MPSLTVPLGGYRDDHAYYGVSSSYPLSNAVGYTADDGTKYAGINLTRQSGGISYVYMTFDLSSIPENVTIKSVTANVKIYGSTTGQSRTTTREIQLYSGSTAKGSAVNFDLAGSSAISTIENSGDWTRAELDDLAVRLYAVRNSSNTTSNTYIYWQGADITIEYEEVSAVLHTITIQHSDVFTTNPDGENHVSEGTAFSVDIYGTGGHVLDNGVDVTDRLVEKTAVSGGELTKYPESYTTSGSINGTRYQNAVGKGSDATATGNDYSGSSSSNATIYYNFDFSDIPENATIESVTVKVGGHLESTSSSSERADLQLYSGSTAKGSKSAFTSTSKQVVDMSAGSWTRAELQEARLAFTIGYYGGLVNGVDFTVVYSVPGGGAYQVYTIESVDEDHLIVISAGVVSTRGREKVNGTYKKILKIYIKRSNRYVVGSESDVTAERLIKLD